MPTPLARLRNIGPTTAGWLAAVGIRAELEPVEWAQWLEQVFRDIIDDLWADPDRLEESEAVAPNMASAKGLMLMNPKSPSASTSAANTLRGSTTAAPMMCSVNT